MSEDKRRILGFSAATVVLAVAVVFLCVLRQQMLSGSEPVFREEPCGLVQIYHLYCPGCGGTRAVAALLRLDILGSLIANPIPLYAGILLVHTWISLLHNIIVSRPGNPSPKLWDILKTWEMWGILVVVIGNFILRNILLVAFNIDLLGDVGSYWG